MPSWVKHFLNMLKVIIDFLITTFDCPANPP